MDTYTVTFRSITVRQMADLLHESMDVVGDVEPSIVVHRPDHFDVVLVSAGPNKIQVIKAIREITGLGLKEAKDLVECLPRSVAEQVLRKDAEKFTVMLNEAGGLAQMR